MKINRVSDHVTTDDIKSWKTGDIITIKAGTGAGKSYFIKNLLYAFAEGKGKKILFLIHRSNPKNQFSDEVEEANKSDVIEIRTYQFIEQFYKKNQAFNFNRYEYIVCDEFHYFMSDAMFNQYTELSLKAILEQTNKTRIFMSATGDYITTYLKDYKKYTTIDYELPISFKFIKDLAFFNKDETMEKFIQQAIEEKKKAIFFVQSAKKAYSLYKKYSEHILFNCGKSDPHYKHVNKEKISNMLNNKKFDELILITTTCMDAGVNIEDYDLQHVVCDVKDVGTLIQCIGRKRLDEDYDDDGIYLFIKTINNQSLGATKNKLMKKQEKAQFLWKNSVEDYIRKYPREYDRSNMIYDEVVEGDSKKTFDKKVNELMYFKCLSDMHDIDMMLLKGNYGYCKYLSTKFGFYDEDGYTYKVVKEDDKNTELQQYLESVVDKVMLQASDRQELIEKVNVRDGNNNRLLKNIETLNGKFKETKMNYLIVQFETSRMINSKKKNFKSAWKVVKVEDKKEEK